MMECREDKYTRSNTYTVGKLRRPWGSTMIQDIVRWAGDGGGYIYMVWFWTCGMGSSQNVVCHIMGS